MKPMRPLPPNIQETLPNLPVQPGVYLMKNADGTILYVGKAKRLKHRVRSYFANSRLLSTRIATMVTQIAEIEYIVTDSEIEALILESTLIKKHQPHYNVLLKDDKNFPYLKLTVAEEFPRIFTVRKIKRDGALYFGPYLHSGALQQTLMQNPDAGPVIPGSGGVRKLDEFNETQRTIRLNKFEKEAAIFKFLYVNLTKVFSLTLNIKP
jgi:predicted GIY-YIG superfamily endonuclease